MATRPFAIESLLTRLGLPDGKAYPVSAQMDSNKEKNLTNIVNASGFPLQIGVGQLVRDTENKHHCKVLYEEHSWQSAETAADGFIDIVLEYSESGYVFVVECKRVQDSEWVFLVSDTASATRRHMKVWETRLNTTKPQHFGWADRTGEPRTPEATFCAVRGQSRDGQPMLERVAAQLVTATEAFAREDSRRVHMLRARTIYTSVLVTTARLVVGRIKADKIDVEKGTVSDAQYSDVPFLRFRKQLSTAHAEPTTPMLPRNLASEKERTVFVVNAASLPNFLGAFEMDGPH